MLDTIQLGKLAASRRYSASLRRGRAGRLAKGENIKKQIQAAGHQKTVPGVFSFPKGQSL